ncbi:spermidine/putrescine transport system substrate-binding protein [Arboricoccus pini]|uniref:Spermidine/putrescine transport system substrate-binding protein n=1 Tax=Arboricoccus pini TaxID=1963835 RepID=A0A212RIX0_9PROT|nr:extracellular solute-binding protein [Arboricoccus pini]SNB72378.1 spermidine/putrescine transport system substrate-binding protein [Arboricoccus pini]
MTVRLSRRHVAGLLSASTALGMIGLPLRRAWAAETITVLNWQGYGTDEKWALQAFTKATGIAVQHDYYSSEPEMITKLRTNPGAYDVAVVNSARTQQLQAEDLLMPLDLSRIPNAVGLTPALRDNPNIHIDGKAYGCAWVWGYNAIAYRQPGIQTPDSYKIFQDPAYEGRLALLDDATNSVAIGALLTAQDMNDPKDLTAVSEQLKAMKKNLKLLWSSEDQWNKGFEAKAFDLAVYWSGASVRSRRTYKLPLGFTAPKEGAIGWFDTLGVPSSSTKAEAALAFVNYMIDPAFYVEWATKVGAPASANGSAMEKLPADDLNRTTHDPALFKSMQFMGPLPDERRQAFADLWEETKAFYAR